MSASSALSRCRFVGVIGLVTVVLVTEAERTQRAITVLILVLVIVACMLAILTAWYWYYTSPRRRARDLHLDQRRIDLTYNQVQDLNQPPAYPGYGHGNGPFQDDPFNRQQPRPFR